MEHGDDDNTEPRRTYQSLVLHSLYLPSSHEPHQHFGYHPLIQGPLSMPRTLPTTKASTSDRLTCKEDSNQASSSTPVIHHHFHHIHHHHLPSSSSLIIPNFVDHPILRTTQFAPSVLGLNQQQQSCQQPPSHHFHVIRKIPSSSQQHLQQLEEEEHSSDHSRQPNQVKQEEDDSSSRRTADLLVVNQFRPKQEALHQEQQEINISSRSSSPDLQIEDKSLAKMTNDGRRDSHWERKDHHQLVEEFLNEEDDEEETHDLLSNGMWWAHLVSGGLAGAVSRTCTAPLDRIKVFLQVRGSEFKSITLCVRHLLSEGGFLSLWRGNGLNVVKIAPENALKFWAYEEAKILIRGNNERELNISERFLAGSIAGSVSQTLIYPMEVLKTRLCLRKTGQYKGAIDAAKKIYRSEGMKAFYRGYLPNLLGIIPYAGIDLAVYETLKKHYLVKYSNGEDPSTWVYLTCGTISSSCGQLASYPLALVRTRLQAQVGIPSKDDPSLASVFRNIIQTEGYRGLYRGITPNFLKVAPAVSISYMVYEHARRSLGATMT